MRAGRRLLFEDQDAGHDERQQRRRSGVTAQCQSAGIERFVQKIADHSTQRARQNECHPKQQGAR